MSDPAVPVPEAAVDHLEEHAEAAPASVDELVVAPTVAPPAEPPVTPPAPAAEAPRKAVEVWAAEKSPEPWLFAAARTLHRWAHGVELTEAEFDDALTRAGGLSFH